MALVLTCTALSACTIFEMSDTVVNTDVGEKIIVKDSAVKVGPWAPHGEDIRKTITDNIPVLLFSKGVWCEPPLNDGFSIPARESGPNSDACREARDRIDDSRETLKLLKSVVKYSGKATRVTYREIRQDLNGKRVADDFYKVISCLDLDLPEDVRAKFSEIDSDIPKPTSDLADDQVKTKLCKKYGAKS